MATAAHYTPYSQVRHFPSQQLLSVGRASLLGAPGAVRGLQPHRERRASQGAPCFLPAGCHGAIWVVMESSEKPHAHAGKKFPQKIGSRRVVAQYFEITYLAKNLPSANTLAWSQSPLDNHHSDVFLSVSVLLAQI